MGEGRGAYWILMGKPEGKSKYYEVYTIKMNHTAIGCEVWTGLIWLRIGKGGGFF
jgi:hypothetical protein